MRFEGFVGNDQAKALVGAAVDGHRLPHALLIEGPSGSGRKLLASIVAAAAVCTADNKPCGVCAACRKAQTGHPDITWLRGNGMPKSLSVDVIRDLREQTAVKPNEAVNKVAVIADADCMNVQAQNALLKILEEPPSYMKFILTVKSRTVLLPTVQSRCMCVSLLGVTENEALGVLKAQYPDTEESELLSRIRLFSGCIGAVKDSFGDETFAQTIAIVTQIAMAITSPTELDLMKATAPMEKDKPLTDAVLSGLKSVLRDALVMSAGGETTVGVAPAASKELSGMLTQKRLVACLETVEELTVSRTRNMNQSLLITLLCARLRAASGR